MAEYNVKINVKTDTGYDQLYPETKSNIVDFDKSNSNLTSTTAEAAIKEVNTRIGTLSSLTTDSKSNIVGAVNEVDSHANTAQSTANRNKTNIGTLSSLKTTIKTSIVNAINWLYDNVVHKANVIDNLDDIIANQSDGMVAGAKAVADLNSKIYSKKVLWTHSGMFLNAGQTINLSEKLSDQKHGIVVVLSRYESGASQNYGYCTYFIPKECLDFGPESPAFDIPLSKYVGSSITNGSKYIYVSDDKITGAATNSTSPNNGWVFRYVIGV